MSVIGCEEEMQDLRLQLEEESAHRKQVEKELELQIQMKAESEMAAKLLEKDIHEKQDTIISLRQQLDEIKVINLEMYRKLQVRGALVHSLPIFLPTSLLPVGLFSPVSHPPPFFLSYFGYLVVILSPCTPFCNLLFSDSLQLICNYFHGWYSRLMR